MEIKKLEGVIEAILFAAGDSVELGKIAAAIEHDEDTTRKIIHQMMDKYAKKDRGIRILELENSFQLCTKKEMYEYLIRIAKQPKKYVLTDVLLETLSIIAYKQPVTKLEVEKIRGVKSDHAVNKLVEYNLVCEVGRMEAPGRPLLFGTTEEFLRRFSIQSVEELPTMNPAKLLEGSSMIITPASLHIAFAMASFWLSPPDRLVPFSSNSLVSGVCNFSGRLCAFA